MKIDPNGQVQQFSIRAWFASLAMQGILSTESERWGYSDSKNPYRDIAEESVKYADALIAELNRDN